MKTPLYAKHDCGCGYSAGSGTFFMCPMHEAAPDLLAALEAMTDRFEEALAATHATRTDRQEIKEARKLVAKAKAGKG